MKLRLEMELSGKEYCIGCITGENISDAAFTYDKNYMRQPYAVPVSVSMPFQDEPFSPEQTRIFFEGLLPEGFTKRTVAHFIHADENDYLKILADLGRECLGALRVSDETERKTEVCDYDEISIDEIRALAKEGAIKSAELVAKAHLSLTGASGKVGLYYDETQDKWYLPRGTAPSTHIVKQSHIRLNSIVINEQLSMLTARNIGIDVPDSFIINTGNRSDAEILFASKRYDRKIEKHGKMIHGLQCPCRCHQEDFAQALGIAAANKYERTGEQYMNRAFELLRNVSVNPPEDQMKLLNMIIFDFLIGNTDAHLKNFSLIYQEDGRGIRLAPAVDIVSTVIYEQSTKEMAFCIGGDSHIDEINRESFARAALQAGLGAKIARKAFDRTADLFETSLHDAANVLKEQGFHQIDQISEKILQRGGYKNLL